MHFSTALIAAVVGFSSLVAAAAPAAPASGLKQTNKREIMERISRRNANHVRRQQASALPACPADQSRYACPDAPEGYVFGCAFQYSNGADSGFGCNYDGLSDASPELTCTYSNEDGSQKEAQAEQCPVSGDFVSACGANNSCDLTPVP